MCILSMYGTANLGHFLGHGLCRCLHDQFLKVRCIELEINLEHGSVPKGVRRQSAYCHSNKKFLWHLHHLSPGVSNNAALLPTQKYDCFGPSDYLKVNAPPLSIDDAGGICLPTLNWRHRSPDLVYTFPVRARVMAAKLISCSRRGEFFMLVGHIFAISIEIRFLISA